MATGVISVLVEVSHEHSNGHVKVETLAHRVRVGFAAGQGPWVKVTLDMVEARKLIGGFPGASGASRAS